LTLSGDAGGTYVLESSSDLVNWSTVTQSVSSNGTLQFISPATNYPSGYYRVYFAPQ
jgi:hypothetical protein